MRIVDIRILGRNLPMTLVELHSDDGLIGIGGSDAPLAVTRPIIEGPPWRLGEVLRSGRVEDMAVLSSRLTIATQSQGGPVVNAMGALDMALWDLIGKKRKLPLHEILADNVDHARTVSAYASATAFDVRGGIIGPLQFKSTPQLTAEAKARVNEGFTAIKFGWGNHFRSEDLDRIAAIRDAIGPRIRLMLDLGGPDYFNPGLTPESAARITESLAQFDLFFFEEPLPPHAFDDYVALSRLSKVPIATGEMLCHPHEFEQLIDERAVHTIQPDAYRIGVTSMVHVARRASLGDVHCVPHSPWSALAIAAHANVVGAITPDAMIEYPSPSLYTDTVRHGRMVQLNTRHLVTQPLLASGGRIELPRSPGLGIGQFNYDAIAEIERLAEEGLER